MISRSFGFTKEYAESGKDLFKATGSRSAGLKKCIQDWYDRNEDKGPYPPTHRLKKECDWWGLPVGTLFHISKRKWRKASWCWSDSRRMEGGGVRFFKTRGCWFYPRMVQVDEVGRMLSGGIFDHPGQEWIREYCEPVKTG